MGSKYDQELKDEELQSKTINFLRFPLIVGVVLTHSRFDEVVFDGVAVAVMKSGDFFDYAIVSYLFSNIFPRVSVPLFFLISGFLFFSGSSYFTLDIYRQKLKKRARTLFVPYLFWNLLTIILYFLGQTFLPKLMSGKQKLISDYSLSDWLWSFWNTNMVNLSSNTNAPVCLQFWFIRDLLVVMIFSPLIYLLIKKLYYFPVIILGVLWMFNYWGNVTGFSIVSIFFFSLGSYFSINNKNLIRGTIFLLPVVAAIYFATTIIILYNMGVGWCSYLMNINIVIGIILAVGLSAFLIDKLKLKINYFFSDGSFFVYAYHCIVLAFIVKLSFRILDPHSDWMILSIYFICPILTILLGLSFYYLLRKFLPKTALFITGGR